jgi:hypothetical protein
LIEVDHQEDLDQIGVEGMATIAKNEPELTESTFHGCLAAEKSTKDERHLNHRRIGEYASTPVPLLI